MNRGIKALVASFVVLGLMAASFAGGAAFSVTTDLGSVIGPRLGITDSHLGDLVDQVDGIIAKNALVPASESTITGFAIQGMLDSLEDTYAAYYSPKDYKELQQEQRGEFFGIGVTLGINKDGQPYATRVFDKTPASRAGVKVGDVFTAVNGVRKKAWDIQDFVDRVRGPIHTKVTLEITRKGVAPFDVTLERDRIVVPNTVTKVYGDVGYVRLMTFNELSADELRKAIEGFDKKGLKGYVLDLRGNPGGLLSSAIDVASLFVPDGPIVRVDERGKPEEVQYATGLSITKKPLVLLVDGNSASASEIVTGALKDYGRATIVGEKTYGKGSVQNIMPIANGGAVKMTIAHYLTPEKRVINGIGVTPDVIVVMDPKLQLDEKTDTQLTKALSVLRSKL